MGLSRTHGLRKAQHLPRGAVGGGWSWPGVSVAYSPLLRQGQATVGSGAVYPASRDTPVPSSPQEGSQPRRTVGGAINPEPPQS